MVKKLFLAKNWAFWAMLAKDLKNDRFWPENHVFTLTTPKPILSHPPVDFINTMSRWYASDPLSACFCCAAVVNQNTGALLLHAFCYCITTCILAPTQHKHNMRGKKLKPYIKLYASFGWDCMPKPGYIYPNNFSWFFFKLVPWGTWGPISKLAW